MKRKYKKRIKKLIKSQVYYKIYNYKENLFKDSGTNEVLTPNGKIWYKIGDVKKAYKLIPVPNRCDYIIVKIRAVVDEIEHVMYY